MQNQAPGIDQLAEDVGRVFKPERLGGIALHAWHLTITIRTDRYQRVTLTELVRLAEVLGVGAENVELWDVAGGVELSVDVDPTTPIETPRRAG